LGVATTRFDDRVASAVGMAGHAVPIFEPAQSVCGAGVLFLLPSLLLQGLLKTKEVYTVPPSHYYGLESVVLTLAFMALARIKNPEQLKQCRPGEIGKTIGLDRIPEVSCLREKVKLLGKQAKAQDLNRLLIEEWYQNPDEECSFLYIDGHVRIYYGSKANLPSKYVSRQKLCLSATTEYWVNDGQGQPVMMVMGELSEKLQHVIEEKIVPELHRTSLLPGPNGDRPVCTLVFDREAWDPKFFIRLWENHGIAVITYRKNVKDNWEPDVFSNRRASVLNNDVDMRLCERETVISEFPFREIRCLTDSGHQTSIVSTNRFITMETVAGRMFGRWSQENFFRYMIMDYDFDKMIEFGIEELDPDKEVVNPEYRKITYKIKKEREKLQRLMARLYPLAEQAMDENIDKTPSISLKQMGIVELAKEHQEKIEKLVAERKSIKSRIKLGEMKDKARYNKLKPESKLLMNIIKMICYRAETAMVNLIDDNFVNEKRMLIKQIIQTSADIVPDISNKTLLVKLHSLSAPRFNVAAQKLADLLTQTETIFPGTELKLIFKTTADSFCDR
jgi:hypothetical protein